MMIKGDLFTECVIELNICLFPAVEHGQSETEDVGLLGLTYFNLFIGFIFLGLSCLVTLGPVYLIVMSLASGGGIGSCAVFPHSLGCYFVLFVQILIWLYVWLNAVGAQDVKEVAYCFKVYHLMFANCPVLFLPPLRSRVCLVLRALTQP